MVGGVKKVIIKLYNMPKKNVTEIPQQVDISSIIAFLELCKNSISENENLILQASKVEKITTPGAQALIAASNSLKNNGKKLIIKEPSEIFNNVFQDLGLSNQLKEWVG